MMQSMFDKCRLNSFVDNLLQVTWASEMMRSERHDDIRRVFIMEILLHAYFLIG
jgi:hypothetical protein